MVLTRQKDESVIIGDDIEVTVIEVRGDKVRLGFTAPKHVQVHRKEIYDLIQREDRAAAAGPAPAPYPGLAALVTAIGALGKAEAAVVRAALDAVVQRGADAA